MRVPFVPNLPVIETWAQWAQVFTDPGLWQPAIEAIARQAALPVTSLSPGFPGTNAVFLVNGGTAAPSYIVKIYAPFCHEDFRIERDVLHALIAYPEIGAPRLLARGMLGSRQSWPYLVLTHVPGVASRAVWDDLDRPTRCRVARDLGRRIGILHTVPPESVPALHEPSAGWDSLAREHLRATCSHLVRDDVLPPSVASDVETRIGHALKGWPTHSLVLVHGDLTEDHVLLVQQDEGWTISGLIDFADCSLAPRAYEWIALWHGVLRHDRAALEAFFAGYEEAQGRTPKVRLEEIARWTLCHEFGSCIVTDLWKQARKPHLDSPEALFALLSQADGSRRE